VKTQSVSVVVVTCNSGEFIFKCLESLKSDYPINELIIVDNGSSDGSIERVKRKFDSVRVILNQHNLGYARAANIGMKNSSSNFIALLNPDTVVEKNWLRELVEATARHPRSAFFQPKIMLLNKPGYINSAGNMIHVAGFGICRGLDEYDTGQYNSEENVSFASGACVLVRREALDEIGMCDDLYYMYMDDLDWGWRGKMFGWESTYVPSSLIHHNWDPTLEVSKEKLYYLELGRMIALTKNLTFRSVLVLSPILIICEIAVLVSALLNRWFSDKIRSYAYMLKLFSEVIKRRKKLMKTRRMPDRAILKNFVTELKHPYIGATGAGLGNICRKLFRYLQAFI
jgi:GT2 family glycosyltransferase